MSYYDSVESLLVSLSRELPRGHDTAWNEFVAQREGREPETCFAFLTLDGEKARKAIALLAAAGLLCETPTGPDNPDDYIQHLDQLTTYPPMAVADGLRALAGTWRAP